MIQKFMICVAGTRTGHNAIAYWLIEQFCDRTYYLNLVNDPYDPFYNFCYDYPLFPQYTKTLIPDHNCFVGNFRYSADQLLLNCEGFGGNKIPITLIQNYIDKHILNKPSILKIVNVNFLIIRDFYNMFASNFMSYKNNFFSYEHIIDQIDLWITHAHEALNITNNIPNKFIIKYNDWNSSVGYRKNLVRILNDQYNFNCTFNDDVRNVVSLHGSYSSFDLDKFQNCADKMKTDIRFKECIVDSEFLELFKSKHDLISKLNEKLFGFKLYIN